MRPRLLPLALCLALTLGSAACGDDDPLGPEDVTFAAELGVDLDDMTRLSTGVYVQTRTVGFGSRTVLATDEVVVDYTLWLPDGTEIDDGDDTTFDLTGSLIAGFVDGLIGMVEGEVRLIVIPPERGYGETPPGGSGIPENAVLVFEVELLDITTVE